MLVAGCSPAAGQPDGTPASASGTTGTTTTSGGPTPAPEPLPDDIPVPAITGQAAGEPGTGLITVVNGGTITATADDGTAYTLVIPPGAVAEDVSVEVRPLSGSTELGPIVAGADFAPAGLDLALAGTLTVELPDGAAPPGLVALAFSGDVASTAGTLLPGPGKDAATGTLVFSVPHFSGSLATDAGSGTGGTAMGTAWLSVGTGTTPAARQAAARTRYAAASLAKRRGTMPQDEAEEIMRRSVQEWMQAELDWLRADGAMTALAGDGDPANLGALATAVSRVYAFEQSRQAEDPGNAESTAAVVQEYGDRLGKVEANLGKGAATAAASGLEDMQRVHGQLVTALAVERQLGFLGGEARGVGDELIGLTQLIATTMADACNGAPVSDAALRDLQRGLALAGDSTSAQAIPDRFIGCDDSTPAPDDTGAFAADGTITFNYSTSTSSATGSSFTSAKVTLDARIREGEYALIFGKGSKFQATWNHEETVMGEGGELTTVEGCPKNHSWSGTVGTSSPDGGWDPGSNASPEADGFAMNSGGDSLDIVLIITANDWTADCSAPEVRLECPVGQFLTGALVGDRPPEWSYQCASSTGDEVVSADGRLVRVVLGN